jgi:hypothetical protein
VKTARIAWVVAGAALLGVATIALTWPLFRHPATQVLDSPTLYGTAATLVQRDIYLTMWVLAWDTHALVTDPLRLFHANALYPAPYTLALSEHMLGNVPLFAPVYLATGNPVLAHQASLAATFVLAGLAMAAYLHHWTRDRVAAIAGGMLFAFAPYRLWQVGNLHVISIYWMPLAPLGVDLALAGRRRAGAALLAASLVGSTLCSYYVGYAAFALAGTYALVSVTARRRAAVPALPALGAGFGAAIAAVALVTIPYLVVQSHGGLPDRVRDEDMASMAFLWLAFHGPLAWTEYFVLPLRDGVPQFLGYCVMALAVVGIVGWPRAPRGALVAAAAVGWLLGSARSSPCRVTARSTCRIAGSWRSCRASRRCACRCASARSSPSPPPRSRASGSRCCARGSRPAGATGSARRSPSRSSSSRCSRCARPASARRECPSATRSRPCIDGSQPTARAAPSSSCRCATPTCCGRRR